jgi:hypothetical protein
LNLVDQAHISPFDILISETKLGHTYTFNLSTYFYFEDTLSEFHGNIEYVPDVSIAYDFVGGSGGSVSIDIPNLSLGHFIKPNFLTYFGGSGYSVTKGASRYFDVISPETVT